MESVCLLLGAVDNCDEAWTRYAQYKELDGPWGALNTLTLQKFLVKYDSAGEHEMAPWAPTGAGPLFAIDLTLRRESAMKQ